MTYGLALAFGALLPLSLAPFGLWPLGAISVAGWFYLLYRAPGRCWLLGWCYGVGKYALGASWVYVSINRFGNAPPPLAAFLVVLFVAGLALFPLLNAWLYQRLKRSHQRLKRSHQRLEKSHQLLQKGRPLADGLLFTGLLVGFEWLLTWVLTGFPWLFVGYAHLDTVLGNLAPVGGVLLVSFALTLSAVMLVVVALTPDVRTRSAAVLLASLPWLAGWLGGAPAWVEVSARREAALIQGNVDQATKWLPQSRGPIYQTYLRLSEPHWDADLVIWPEAAITFMQHEATQVLGQLNAEAQANGSTLVLGLPALERLPDGDVVFRNTAVALGVGRGRYVKRRLVPFGEYVPLEDLLRGLIEFFDLPMSHSEPGSWHQPLLDIGGARAAMAICYEVVYPELVREQGRQSDVLLTISNDTWFGRSIGPLQHQQMARMRALENGRWMLRGTNNGVTAIIDHTGRVRASLPQFQEGALRGEFALMTGYTPFARFGQTPLLVLLLLMLGSLAYLRFRRGVSGDAAE